MPNLARPAQEPTANAATPAARTGATRRLRWADPAGDGRDIAQTVVNEAGTVKKGALTMTETTMRRLAGQGTDLVEFSADGAVKRVLGVSPGMRVVLVGLEAGQEIPAHAPDTDLAVAILHGDARVLIGDDLHELRAGDVATVPAGDVRGVEAGPVGTVAMLVSSPPPSQTHFDSVRDDLKWPVRHEVGEEISMAVSAEHAHLRPAIEDLGELASEIVTMDEAERRVRLAEAVAFLRDDLLEHSVTEEEILYPPAELVLRARGGAAGVLALGHDRIAQMVADLEAAAARADLDRLPSILYSLRAVVLLHLDQEERVYVPALAGATAAEAEAMGAALGLSLPGGGRRV